MFQWSDGWWKYKQEENLDVRTNASWPNGGYPDFVEGFNNMNEEWFGINAKSRPDADGHYQLYPRTAYFTLQHIWRLDPYVEGTTIASVDEHFNQINFAQFDATYTTILNQNRVEKIEKLKLNTFLLKLSSNFSTRNPGGGNDQLGSIIQSLHGFEARPTARSRADPLM